MTFLLIVLAVVVGNLVTLAILAVAFYAVAWNIDTISKITRSRKREAFKGV